MLLLMSKIHSIEADHPVLIPDIRKDMDFYTGYYYIKEKIAIGEMFIEPGLLEVYITYTSNYIEGSNTEYYVNYKLFSKDGRIFTWRYYLHKEEETVYLLNTGDSPNMLLSKNRIENIVYNRDEMEERFLTKNESNIDDRRYFISTPLVEQREINGVDNNFDFIGDNLYSKNKAKYFDIQKDIGYSNFFDITKDRSVYADYNFHTSTNERTWTDLFNLGSEGSWDKNLIGDTTKVSEANGKIFQSQLKVYGVNPIIDLAYIKMGEYFTDVGKMNSKLNPDGKNHTYRIVNNTFLPGIVRSKSETGVSSLPKYSHPRYYNNEEIAPFYMVRSIITPDERMTTIPIIYYGHNESGDSFDKYVYEDRRYLPPTEDDLTTITKPKHTKPRQWNIGMILSSNKNNIDLEEMFGRRNSSSHLISSSYYYEVMNKISWGKYFLNSISTGNKTDDLHINLFDIEPSRVLYRCHSNNVDNDTYIDAKLDALNKTNAVTDIRLGPEVRTVYDRSTTLLSDPSSRLIKIDNADPSMALTYFKAEIVKESPRYTMENRELAYSIAHPEQLDFSNRMRKRLNLKPDEKLAIDRVTVGFRPIQIEVNGVWKNIGYKKG